MNTTMTIFNNTEAEGKVAVENILNSNSSSSLYTTPVEMEVKTTVGNFTSADLKNVYTTLVENQTKTTVGNFTSADLKNFYTTLVENQTEKVTAGGNIISSDGTHLVYTTQAMGHEDYGTTMDFGNFSLNNTSGINSTDIGDHEAGYFFPGAVWILLIVLLLATIVWVCCKRHVLHVLGFRKAGPKAGTCAACWQSCYRGDIPPNSVFSNLQSNAMK